MPDLALTAAPRMGLPELSVTTPWIPDVEATRGSIAHKRMNAAQNNPRPIFFICLLTQVEAQVHDNGANSAALGPNARMLTAFARHFQASKPHRLPANVGRSASLT